MMTNAMAHPRRASLTRSAGSRAARLLIFGLPAWFWFFAAHHSPWTGISLVVVLALAAVVGINWCLSRALADRRRRAVLDRYAEQELAKRTHSRRNLHARP